MTGFNLGGAEAPSSNYGPIPKNTPIKVSLEFQGPNDKMREVRSQNPAFSMLNGLVVSTEATQVKDKEGKVYDIPAKDYVKMAFTVIGTADGKYLKKKIFHNAVINGGNPKNGDFEAESKHGINLLMQMLCSWKGVKYADPDGYEVLKGQPNLIPSMSGAEFAMTTSVNNKNINIVYDNNIIPVGDNRRDVIMSYGAGGQQNGGFGGSSSGGFGGQSQDQQSGFGNSGGSQSQGGGWH